MSNYGSDSLSRPPPGRGGRGPGAGPPPRPHPLLLRQTGHRHRGVGGVETAKTHAGKCTLRDQICAILKSTPLVVSICGAQRPDECRPSGWREKKRGQRRCGIGIICFWVKEVVRDLADMPFNHMAFGSQMQNRTEVSTDTDRKYSGFLAQHPPHPSAANRDR